MKNYPVVSLAEIDGVNSLVLNYAYQEECEGVDRIIIQHEKCFHSAKDGGHSLVFISKDGKHIHTVITEKNSEESNLLSENKLRQIITTYRMEDGRIFYNPAIPILFAVPQ